MSEVRELREEDAEALEAFLTPQADGYLHMLSNLARVGLTPGQKPYQGRYVGAFAGGRLTGVAALFWNGVLTLCVPEETAALAVRAVGSRVSAMTGIYGPSDQVTRAMQVLGVDDGMLGSKAALDLMALDLERMVHPVLLDDGDLRTRLVRSSEADLVANWFCRFEVEVFSREESSQLHGQMLETVQRRRREHALWVLERRGQLVACCGFSARYRELVQVGPVWVPPGLRNAGYARAVAAGALLKAQAEGTRRAVLLGDDPAAKRAYLALGFERAGERVLAFLDRAMFEEQRRLTA